MINLVERARPASETLGASPLLSYVYGVLRSIGASVRIGLTEIAFRVLLALHRWWLSENIILFGAPFWALGQSMA